MQARRFFALVLALVTVLAVPHATAGSDAPEERLLWWSNEARQDEGTVGLQSRGDVQQIALDHSRDMAAQQRLFHNDAYFSDESRARVGGGALGENVAFGPTIESVQQALMQSEHHRDNIVDKRFRVAGIAAVFDGSRWWVTEDFVEPRG